MHLSIFLYIFNFGQFYIFVVNYCRWFWWVILHLQGKVAFVSAYGIHQLHIFIFVLAIFHILQCIVTLALGRTKVYSHVLPPILTSEMLLYIVSELVCGIFLCCSVGEFIVWFNGRRWESGEHGKMKPRLLNINFITVKLHNFLLLIC